MRNWGLRLLKVAYIGLIAALPVAALANYAATVGAGTNFGSVIIGGVHFASQLLCDFTTANQCAAVKAASTPAALTDTALVVQNAQEHLDMTAQIPACTSIPCNLIGYVSNDPCATQLKTNFPIGGAGGNIQIVGGVAAKKVYLCSLSLIAAATAVVNIIEGTGAACITANELAVVGSTTAANGMSLAANGGLTLGNGGGTVGVTATAANGMCILQSGTTALAGNATYVQQ